MQLRPQLGAKLIKDSAFGRIVKGSKEMNIAVETRAPSQPVLVVGVLVAMLAIFLYFLPGAGNENGAFWLMAFAYVVSSLGTLVRT